MSESENRKMRKKKLINYLDTVFGGKLCFYDWEMVKSWK